MAKKSNPTRMSQGKMHKAATIVRPTAIWTAPLARACGRDGVSMVYYKYTFFTLILYYQMLFGVILIRLRRTTEESRVR